MVVLRILAQRHGARPAAVLHHQRVRVERQLRWGRFVAVACVQTAVQSIREIRCIAIITIDIVETLGRVAVNTVDEVLTTLLESIDHAISVAKDLRSVSTRRLTQGTFFS